MSQDSFSSTFDLDEYDKYMAVRPLEQRIMVEYIRDKLEKEEEIMVVEIGAGTGRFTKLYSGIEGITAVLVEPDSGCRAKLKDEYKTRIIDSTAESIDLQDFADVVVMATAFHHIPYDMKLQALKRIRQALKSGCGASCAVSRGPRSVRPRGSASS